MLITVIKKAAFRYAWLFFTAAWLYTLSFIFTNYLAYNSSASKAGKVLEKYVVSQEKSFDNLLADSASVAGIIKDSSTAIKHQLARNDVGIFAYQVNDLGHPIQIFWNTNKMAVDADDLSVDDANYLVTYQNGSFELIRKVLQRKGKQYLFCALIPIHWEYFIQNEYLKSTYALTQDISNTYEIRSFQPGYAIKSIKGNILFYVHGKPNIYADKPGGFSIFLRAFAIILLLIFVNRIAEEINFKKSFKRAFIFLISVIVVLRAITYFVPFPFNYRDMELFDPRIYASSIINPSLGDLLINTLLFFWILIFFRSHCTLTVLRNIKFDANVLRTTGIISLMALPIVSGLFGALISSLVLNSTVSLDASDFFSLNLYTVISFTIICLLMYMWFYVAGILIVTSRRSEIKFFWRVIILAACSLLIITVKIFNYPSDVSLGVGVWLLIYFILFERRRSPKPAFILQSGSIIMWAAFLTASAAALLVFENNALENDQRKSIAEKLEIETDRGGLSLLSMATSGFSDEFLRTNYIRFESEYSNKFLKDSLINQNFEAYINKYDTHVYTFDSLHRSIFNDDNVKYDVINSVIENRAKELSVPNLFSYQSGTRGLSYIFKKEIRKQDSTYLGAIFIVAQPRSFQTDALEPVLFNQVSDTRSDVNSNYSYAVYKDKILITTYNTYSFPDSIVGKVPLMQFEFTDADGYNELWYNAGDNKEIVVVKKNNGFVSFISLFAYLFIQMIFIVGLLHIGKRLYDNRLQGQALKKVFQFNIRTQIQITIISVSIFSFLVIGAATITFFILNFEKDNQDKIVNTSKVISNEIEDIMKSQITVDQTTDFTSPGVSGNLEKKIKQLAGIHNADINFFSKDGVLIATSQPSIYSHQVLSSRMPPLVYYNLHYGRNIQVMQHENIGSFSYVSIYLPVKDDNDAVIAYLNLPSLNSQTALQDEIANFLVTLIILIALILIATGSIAVLFTGRITQSLELIGNKMKQINFGQTNEEIVWKTEDEIGILVNEYNRMVQKLEQSAQALARSEREGAWRQMAQQVAHEIKNPLTPMKLSIQYLQKAVANNAPNTKELSQSVAATLVEQIDQLAKIASDFYQFANIGNINNEKFDLGEIMQNLVNLYKADANLNVVWHHPDEPLFINSDKVQVSRLFTNLIKNGIEASNADEVINIHIKQYALNGKIITSITDNGGGIAEDKQPRIFDPNFTTKTSGTGLGLAICKAIVEKANGRIWFETEKNIGTTFFVEFNAAETIVDAEAGNQAL